MGCWTACIGAKFQNLIIVNKNNNICSRDAYREGQSRNVPPSFFTGQVVAERRSRVCNTGGESRTRTATHAPTPDSSIQSLRLPLGRTASPNTCAYSGNAIHFKPRKSKGHSRQNSKLNSLGQSYGFLGSNTCPASSGKTLVYLAKSLKRHFTLRRTMSFDELWDEAHADMLSTRWGSAISSPHALWDSA